MNSEALEIDLAEEGETNLGRFPLHEDAVIEHDARTVPGLELIHSEMTGRAVFRNGNELLEVFTANKRPLEELFGVDLIYLNLTRHTIAMVQYKMLESEGEGQWVYRPDRQMLKEIARMDKFTMPGAASQFEYRLNPGAFYIKFVKRNAILARGGIVLPLEHYKQIVEDPRSRGEREGIRVDYGSLGGRYLRDDAFLSLLRSGYIGPYAETTQSFADLVQAVLDGGRAVVGAIAYPAPPEPSSQNDEEDLDEDARPM